MLAGSTGNANWCDHNAAHDFNPSDPVYQNQFRTENGIYFVAVAPANDAAIALYETMGFDATTLILERQS